jgi:hypothetical protein
LVDENGTLHKKPPVDAERWKEIKRVASRLLSAQSARLEHMMADDRRISLEHFAEVYLMHPLVRLLTAHLLWGAYRDEALVEPFLVEDLRPTRLDGSHFVLPGNSRVGVLHPIDLDDAQRFAWRKRAPTPPFLQLDRPIFAPEECDTALRTMEGRQVSTVALYGLARHGWLRGPIEDGGCYYSMVRKGAGCEARMFFMPGIYVGNPRETEIQTVERIDLTAERLPAALASELQYALSQLQL